jgi:hypothetical protein
MASGVQVTRPVVRLDLGGRPVLFTRVFPESKSTSLLIRYYLVCRGLHGCKRPSQPVTG